MTTTVAQAVKAHGDDWRWNLRGPLCRAYLNERVHGANRASEIRDYGRMRLLMRGKANGAIRDNETFSWLRLF